MESLDATPKCKLALRARNAKRNKARKPILKWIEVFCNHKRLNFSLSYKCPADYEAAA
jgi:hypothetical protein